MGKISILGNQNPEIGTPQQYSIFKAFEIPAIQSPAFGNHQEVAPCASSSQRVKNRVSPSISVQ
jgi:hypothetical protein